MVADQWHAMPAPGLPTVRCTVGTCESHPGVVTYFLRAEHTWYKVAQATGIHPVPGLAAIPLTFVQPGAVSFQIFTMRAGFFVALFLSAVSVMAAPSPVEQRDRTSISL